MNIITLENHPGMTAVFNAQGMSMREAGEKARELVLSPRFNAVVALRESTTLAETVGKIVRLQPPPGELKLFLAAYKVRKGKVLDDGRETTMDAVRENAGPDYAALAEYLIGFGNPADLYIKYIDKGSELPHLDNATDMTTAPEDFKGVLVPHPITVTMAPTGGGTVLFDLGMEAVRAWIECRSSTTDKNLQESKLAAWEAKYITPENTSVVPNGAICAMKSISWLKEKDHIACMHKSSPRKKPCYDAAERNVGVAQVSGQRAARSPRP